MKARPPDVDAQTPMERFTSFARAIVAVPKAEADARAKAYEKVRKKKRKTA